jgi:hypothetical protein
LVPVVASPTPSRYPLVARHYYLTWVLLVRDPTLPVPILHSDEHAPVRERPSVLSVDSGVQLFAGVWLRAPSSAVRASSPASMLHECIMERVARPQQDVTGDCGCPPPSLHVARDCRHVETKGRCRHSGLSSAPVNHPCPRLFDGPRHSTAPDSRLGIPGLNHLIRRCPTLAIHCRVVSCKLYAIPRCPQRANSVASHIDRAV